MQAYCSTCKTMRDIANAQTTRTADGKPLTRGTCAVCGSALMRLGRTEDGGRTTDHLASPLEASSEQGDTPQLPMLNNAVTTSPQSPTSDTKPSTPRRKQTVAPKRTSRSRR
ncbi:MAG TPA: DUF5679 domain-containing protein, partial [Anaerolineae bacterium]|nr:DUF5679 domain-containing protein [Anaerolineae bacterium]